MAEKFDMIYVRLLRVAGLVLALHEVFINDMANPETLLLAGSMIGGANLLKPGANQ